MSVCGVPLYCPQLCSVLCFPGFLCCSLVFGLRCLLDLTHVWTLYSAFVGFNLCLDSCLMLGCKPVFVHLINHLILHPPRQCLQFGPTPLFTYYCTQPYLISAWRWTNPCLLHDNVTLRKMMVLKWFFKWLWFYKEPPPTEEPFFRGWFFVYFKLLFKVIMVHCYWSYLQIIAWNYGCN